MLVKRMISDVQVMGKGRFIVNNAIVIYDIDFDGDEFTYSLNWDDDIISEPEAKILADEFMSETITGIQNKDVTE